MLTRVRALSYEDMLALVTTQPELLQEHVFLSILYTAWQGQPQLLLLPADNERCLTVFYDDIVSTWALDVHKAAVRGHRQMSDEDAAAIVRFLRRSHERPGAETLYVNCAYGVSRSGAVVSLVQELFGLPSSEVIADNPRIEPNRLQVAILREAAALTDCGLF